MTPEIRRRLAAAAGVGPKEAGDLVILLAVEQTIFDRNAGVPIVKKYATQPTLDYEGRLIVGPRAIGSSAYVNGELVPIAPLEVGRLALANTDGGLDQYLDPRSYVWSGHPGVIKVGAVDLHPSEWETLPPGGTLTLAQAPTPDTEGNLGLVYLPPGERMGRLAQPRTFAGWGYAYRFHRLEADENWIDHGDVWDFGKLSFAFQVVMRVSPRQTDAARVLLHKRDTLTSGPGFAWIGRALDDSQRVQVEDDLGNEIEGDFPASFADVKIHTYTVSVDRDAQTMTLTADDGSVYKSVVDASLLTGAVSALEAYHAILGWTSHQIADDRADFDIAELRVWHKALTDQEIKGNFDRTISPETPGLEALYRFNVNEGGKSYNERGGPRSRWIELTGGWVEATQPGAGRPHPTTGEISATIHLGSKTEPVNDTHVWGKMDYSGSSPIGGWALWRNGTTQELEVIVTDGVSSAKVSIPAATWDTGRLQGIAFRYDPAGGGLTVYRQPGRDLPLELIGSAAGTFLVPEASALQSLLQPASIAEPDATITAGPGGVSWHIHGAATHHAALALDPTIYSYVEVPHDRDPVLEVGLPTVTPPGGGADYQVVFAYAAPQGQSGIDLTIELWDGGAGAVATWIRSAIGPEEVFEVQKVPQAGVDNTNLSLRYTLTQGTPPVADDPTTTYGLAVYTPSILLVNGSLDLDEWHRMETDDVSLQIVQDTIDHGPKVDRETWISPTWSPTSSESVYCRVEIPLGGVPQSHDFTRLRLWAGNRRHDGNARDESHFTISLRHPSTGPVASKEIYATGDEELGFRLTPAESAALQWGGALWVDVTKTAEPALPDSHPVIYEIWLEADFSDPESGAGYEGRILAGAVIGGADFQVQASTATATPGALTDDELLGMLNYYLVPPDDYEDLPIDPVDPVSSWLDLSEKVLDLAPLVWRLDERSGSDVRDVGPGRYDGTLYGPGSRESLDGVIAEHQGDGTPKGDELNASENPLDQKVLQKGEWIPTYEGMPELVGTLKPVVAGSAMGVPLVHVGGDAWMISDPELGRIAGIRRIYANGLPIPSYQWSLVSDQNAVLLGPGFEGFTVTADVYGIVDTTGVSGPDRFLWRTDHIAERLLGEKGAGLELNSPSLADYGAEVPWRIGLAYGLDRRWKVEELMRALVGGRGWWSQAGGGRWRLLALRDVSTATPDLILEESAIESVRELPTKDPASVIRLGVRRQWQTVGSFLGAVSAPDRDRQGQEWRRSVYPDPALRDSIKIPSPRSREMTPTSPISGEGDGELEVERLARVWSLSRRYLELQIREEVLELVHGQVLSFSWPRLALSTAYNWIVIGNHFGMDGARPVWTLVVVGPWIVNEWEDLLGAEE